MSPNDRNTFVSVLSAEPLCSLTTLPSLTRTLVCNSLEREEKTEG